MKMGFSGLSSFLVRGRIITIMMMLVFYSLSTAFAQINSEESAPSKRFEIKPRAANSNTLVSGTTKIKLWGADSVDGASPVFTLRARTALENMISGKTVQCELKGKTATQILAQCVNNTDIDLGLFMIQQGYASVDRSSVYNSIFEEAYIQAEMEAQARSLGIWAENLRQDSGSSSHVMLSFGFVLFICIIAAFTVLSIVIMRGFQKVIDAQNTNVEMMGRERELRQREQRIVAVMLDSEIKANKAKIEAFLVVYEEMLRSLKDADKEGKSKKASDIVQKQPALERAVFDRNTDKLEILGAKLSSEVIHFYARIKSKPEYHELGADIELSEAIAMIEGVLENARRLDKLAGDLIDELRDHGVLEE